MNETDIVPLALPLYIPTLSKTVSRQTLNNTQITSIMADVTLKSSNKTETIPKGRNVSGRSWKTLPQKRASSLRKTSFNGQTKAWNQRQQERLARKEMLEMQQELREERRQAKITKKERRLENERRRAENEFKQAQKSAKQLNLNKLSSTLQAMSKKQLRQIKKTRLNPKTGVVEYVPAFSK